jgi:hypothetical protein
MLSRNPSTNRSKGGSNRPFICSVLWLVRASRVDESEIESNLSTCERLSKEAS